MSKTTKKKYYEMKFIRTITTGVLACMAVAVMAADYTTEGQYVTIPVKKVKAGGAQVVRLQVVNDNIIRVQATSTMPMASSC